MWDFPLPSGEIDNFREDSRGDRRTSPRVRCLVSAELHSAESPTTWAKATDLRVGGCFLEMPIPMKQGAKVEIALWISGAKLRLQAEVVSSAPGYGIGIKFLDVSPQDAEILRGFIKTSCVST
jgi:PilZ domain